MQRFPSEKDELRRMYTSSESFQTLCDDYQKCTEALVYWRQSGQDQALEREREYKELKQSLEEEIKERIGAIR